jgi:hypothetical protein
MKRLDEVSVFDLAFFSLLLLNLVSLRLAMDWKRWLAETESTLYLRFLLSSFETLDVG